MATPVNIYSAFSSKAHECLGNPCAVIQLEEFPSDHKLQSIASCLQQPATAFIIKSKTDFDTYQIRWFAPDAEIALCGHGALASAYHIFNQEGVNEIKLITKNDQLIKAVNKGVHQQLLLEPIPHEISSDAPDGLETALGSEIVSYHITPNKHIVALKNETAVKEMVPDYKALKKIDVFGYAVTAESNDHKTDFVSRTLVPHVHQLEDYATGSSHLALFPFWRDKLNKNSLEAKQLSFRGGYFRGDFEDALFCLTGASTHLVKGDLMIE